jgi:hypothetical protein
VNKYKVKAFTILEVTISMLVTALVIGITYTAYVIIIKSYHAFTKKNEDLAVLISLDHLLKRDFDKADTILNNEDGIILFQHGQTVKYLFASGFISRNAAKVDTFKLQSSDITTSFEGRPVNETQSINEQNRIDALDFTLLFKDEKIPYHYQKLYSSENLIKRETDAIN